MISSVRGEVLSLALDHVVVDVAGVGFAVQTTPATLATLRRGEQVRLHTFLVVRDDSLALFGFADPDARDLFALLLTVSGIGPRLALAALAVLEPDALRAAVAEGDTAVLTRVPGIGRKGAERLTLELRDKVLAPAPAAAAAGPAPTGGGVARAQVVDALVGLGFATKQAEQAVSKVMSADPAADTAGVLRAALASLGRK